MFYSRYALTALKLGFQLACISDIYESGWKKKVICHFLGKKKKYSYKYFRKVVQPFKITDHCKGGESKRTTGFSVKSRYSISWQLGSMVQPR